MDNEKKPKESNYSDNYLPKDKMSNYIPILVKYYDTSLIPKGLREFYNIQELSDEILFSKERKILKDNSPSSKGNESSIGLVEGTIISIKPNEILLNIGKEDIFIDPKKDNLNIDELEIGSKITVFAERQKGNVVGSISRAWKEQTRLAMEKSLAEKTKIPFVGIVKECIYGGYWMYIKGNQVFLPGSLADLNKLEDFKSLLGKTITVYIVNKEKDALVASRREYLKDLSIEKSQQFKEGDRVKVELTGFTNFGVFTKLDEGVFAVLSNHSMNAITTEAIKNRKIEKGEILDCWVKEFDNKGRILLTQKQNELSPWIFINETLPIGTIVKGVVRNRKGSMYISIAKDVMGKLSKHDKCDDLIEGQDVNVVVMSIDRKNRTIVLKRTNFVK